jgi:hypothetical protein
MLPHAWSRETLALHLYEIAVTNAADLARFAQALAPKARTLREDFAGSGALARAWANRSTRHQSFAVEKNREVAQYVGEHPRITTLVTDATRCTQQADILAATNFPLGYFHERSALIKYLRHARKSLKPKGVFFADMYGGDGAWTPQVQKRVLRSPIVGRFTYEWEQARANASTGLVTNHIHFHVGSRAGIRLERAFTYTWRLWGLAELREAFMEAGFRSVDVYDQLADAIDDEGNAYVSPVDADGSLDATWVVYIVGRR